MENKTKKNKRAPVTNSRRESAARRAARKAARKNPDSAYNRYLSVIFLSVAAFLLLCFFFPSLFGAMGNAVRRFFFGMLGGAAFAIPPILILLAVTRKTDVKLGNLTGKYLSAGLLVLFVSVLLYAFGSFTEFGTVPPDVGVSYDNGGALSGGGVIGNGIGFYLVAAASPVGVALFSAFIFIFFLVCFFNFNPQTFVSSFIPAVRKRIAAMKKKADAAKIVRAATVKAKKTEPEVIPETEEKTEELPIDDLPVFEPSVDETLPTDENPPIPEEKTDFSCQSPEDYPLDNDIFFTSADRYSTVTKPEHEDAEDKLFISPRNVPEEREPSAPIAVSRENVGSYREAALNAPSETHESYISSPASDTGDYRTLLCDAEENESTGYDVTETVPPPEPIPDVQTETIYPYTKEEPVAESPSVTFGTRESVVPENAVNEAEVPLSSTTVFYRTAAESDATGEKRGFDFAGYRFPEISFLTPQDRTDDSTLDEEVRDNMQTLIETLRAYGVEAEPRGATRGPRITRYEIRPATGVKVNAITGLQNEIAMNLCAESLIMEAPIPGDNAIGIQVPNKKSAPVRLRALIDTEEFRNAASTTTVALGADIAGNHVYANIADMPHMLVAGATGMGKSVCINTLITSILYKARPDQVRLILVDPKMVEFNIYQGIPHLLVPVINDVKQAIGALNWAAGEMDRRFKLISAVNARNLDDYTAARQRNPDMEPLPRIIIIIDELNDLILSMKNSKPLDDVICRIAQKARAAGIHLILGTQRPTVNVITGNIKANISARIAFKVNQKIDSTTIIDTIGAEKLLDKGDMIFLKSSKQKRIQCCLVDTPEIEKIVDFLRANTDGDVYDQSAMAGINKATAAAEQDPARDAAPAADAGGHISKDERQFWTAVDVTLQNNRASTSLLERKVGIGYGRAAKIIDKMEDLGIVSPQDEKRAREILMTPDEVAELRATLTGRITLSVGDSADTDDDAETDGESDL